MNLPKHLYGGVTAGEWPQLNADDYAKKLKQSGCNCNLIEAMAPQYGDNWERGIPIATIVTKVIQWVKAMQQQKLWTVIHWVNGNDEDRLKAHGLQGHKDALKKLMTECGTNYVILCPVAEKNNDSLEADWERHCLSVWPAGGGHLAYNGTARPGSLPSGYAVLDYHMQRQDDFGPTVAGLVLLDTDNGPIINSLKSATVPAGAYWDPVKVSNWAKAVYSKGKSLNLYQSSSAAVDTAAMRAVAVAYGQVPGSPDSGGGSSGGGSSSSKPEWFEKLEAWWKSIWKRIKR